MVNIADKDSFPSSRFDRFEILAVFVSTTLTQLGAFFILKERYAYSLQRNILQNNNLESHDGMYSLYSRVSALNSGWWYLPDNRFMKPVLQNRSIAKQLTCILFSCSPSLTRSFDIS